MLVLSGLYVGVLIGDEGGVPGVPVSLFPISMFCVTENTIYMSQSMTIPNIMTCKSSETSDQPGHLPSLISLSCVLNG